MQTDIPNIEFKKPGKNPTLDSADSEYELPLYKDTEYFSNLDNFVAFVNAVKRMVRSSDEYPKYISHLKQYGLTACQVLSNIEDEYAEIEMHHGPILSLFDIISIVVDHLLSTGKRLTTFMVADIVIQEHCDNNIQVVMLSTTVHEQVEENNIFINFKQGFGDIATFLRKYNKGLTKEQVTKINAYLERSREYDSFDNGVLEISDIVKNWDIENEW